LVINYPRTLNWRHCNVWSQIGHPVEHNWVSSVEICSSTWSVNNDGGKVW
jgi:hypothetical protein